MPLNETLKAISDPVRRQILESLKSQSLCAGDIASLFTISQAAVSRHLSVLKKADLIRSIQKGKYIYYELNTSVLDEALIWLHSFSKGESEYEPTKLKSKSVD